MWGYTYMPQRCCWQLNVIPGPPFIRKTKLLSALPIRLQLQRCMHLTHHPFPSISALLCVLFPSLIRRKLLPMPLFMQTSSRKSKIWRRTSQSLECWALHLLAFFYQESMPKLSSFTTSAAMIMLVQLPSGPLPMTSATTLMLILTCSAWATY